MEIAFSGKNTRNDSVKLLSTYAGLADGQKYITEQRCTLHTVSVAVNAVYSCL